MVFSSIQFLFLFLPAFLLVQVLLPWNNLTFVLFSLLFYFIGEGWFSAIIILSVITNFGFAIGIDSAATLCARRLCLAAGIGANLCLLLFFKYVGFIAENLFAAPEKSWIRSGLFAAGHIVLYLPCPLLPDRRLPRRR